uniref:Uncharacterized protein n=1 Tax=Physcomitrium patens TaxID=3218 RepID=A0A7I3Z8E3_PHYPA
MVRHSRRRDFTVRFYVDKATLVGSVRCRTYLEQHFLIESVLFIMLLIILTFVTVVAVT